MQESSAGIAPGAVEHRPMLVPQPTDAERDVRKAERQRDAHGQTGFHRYGSGC